MWIHSVKLFKGNANRFALRAFKEFSKCNYSTAASSPGIQDDNASESWDIVISGGGLVGSAMACALGISPVLTDQRILLLEGGSKITKPKLPGSYSNRVTSINSGSKEFLSDIGAWEKISNMRFKMVKKLQVWESCSNSVISFEQPSMVEDISYIVENNVILSSLSDCLDELQESVTVWNGVKAVSYELPSQGGPTQYAKIKLQDGRQLKTKLLIGADGFNSLVRKSMNVQYISWNYDRRAIVATLKYSEPTENIVAWQKFLPTGSVALLPLTDDSSSLVWVTTPKMAEQLMEMDDESFTDALNKALWKDNTPNPFITSLTSTVEKIMSNLFPNSGSPFQLPPSIFSTEAGSRATFPIGLGHAVKYVAPHVALIGDAAHRVHPLAGLGVNLGYGDARCLSETISDGIYNGNYMGFSHDLASYETKRQKHNIPVMLAIDQLNRLYGNDFAPVVLIRSLGLQMTNMCPIVKREIIKYASL